MGGISYIDERSARGARCFVVLTGARKPQRGGAAFTSSNWLKELDGVQPRLAEVARDPAVSSALRLLGALRNTIHDQALAVEQLRTDAELGLHMRLGEPDTISVPVGQRNGLRSLVPRGNRVAWGILVDPRGDMQLVAPVYLERLTVELLRAFEAMTAAVDLAALPGAANAGSGPPGTVRRYGPGYRKRILQLAGLGGLLA